ncbi:MAG: VOC family protein [Noviherbaspirillum sp.]
MAQIAAIERHHHITLCVGGAQEDYDFHTKVLGLKSVKKTAIYDGDIPVHHLYYGNDMGEESTLVTCFPMRQSGRKARPGVGQIKTLALSVPVSSFGFWKKHLVDHGFTVTESERFGERVLRFSHPCGVPYELVAIPDDARTPYSNGAIPSEFGIRGTHGITVSVGDVENSDEFMQNGWTGKHRRTDGQYVRYELGEGGSGTIIDYQTEAGLPAASWSYGEGSVHHCAFQVADKQVQDKVKFRLETQGYTDVSERKDRGYFESIYVRTPSGALFEATVSKPQAFLIDESYENMGSKMQIPPIFEHRRAELVRVLEPIAY